MKVADVVAAIDAIAPFSLASERDNVGLLVGRADADVERVLVSLDVIEATIDEARSVGASVLVTHHPAIFRPLASVTGATPAGRRVQDLIRAGIAHVAAHTNLDAAPGGVNDALAEAVGLAHARPFAPPDEGHVKVVVFTPEADVERVEAAAFAAGAGVIGRYTACSFRAPGTGAFRGGEGSAPAVGEPGRREEAAELRIEFRAPRPLADAVVAAVRAAHSYEEPAIDVYPLLGAPDVGLGRVGRLAEAVAPWSLVDRLCAALNCPGALAAGDLDRPVRTLAVVAGSSGGTVTAALNAGAECVVTGEIGHHAALDAVAAGCTVLAAGHYATERVVLPRLAERLRDALPAIDVLLSRSERAPLAWHPAP